MLLAEENARKHREQRDIAETLQLSLLPQRLTPPPGVTLASRYWPAGSASLIGGDFYDAFRIDGQRWGIVIGDVCGKGIDAAALTGLVRHTIRATSRTTDSPAAVLHEVHAAVAEQEPATFCTVCFITYSPHGADPAAGGTLTVALGGHPAPLLGRAGTVREIGRSGTILGMVEPTIVDSRWRSGPATRSCSTPMGSPTHPTSRPCRCRRSRTSCATASTVTSSSSPTRSGVCKRRRRPSGSSDDTAVLVLRFHAPFDHEPGTADAAHPLDLEVG